LSLKNVSIEFIDGCFNSCKSSIEFHSHQSEINTGVCLPSFSSLCLWIFSVCLSCNCITEILCTYF
jgi:hypothetical protein